MTRYIIGAILLLLGSFLLIGCPPKQTPPPPPGPMPQPRPPAAMTPAMPSTTVTATLTEYKIVLTPSTVPAGDVTFQIMNHGKMLHALEIEGQGIKTQRSKDLKPGGTDTLVVKTLKAGKYTVDCPIANHEKLGMTTTLTVTPPAAGMTKGISGAPGEKGAATKPAGK